MKTEIVVEMMGGDFLLWRCLHGGPLSHATIDRWALDSDLPWARYRARNLALIQKLDDVYGACAVVARHCDEVVGQLRFYPKAVWQMQGAGFLCLQQDFPAGPVDDFATFTFLPRQELADQTLKVHCLMTGSPQQSNNPFQRRGIGTRLVQKLVEWAKENGWKAIEAEAFEDLPIIYAITGSAGHTFWEKLGFAMVDRFPHPDLAEATDFLAKLEQQAEQAGMSKQKARDCMVMRLELV
jgi:hypothetical protein